MAGGRDHVAEEMLWVERRREERKGSQAKLQMWASVEGSSGWYSYCAAVTLVPGASSWLGGGQDSHDFRHQTLPGQAVRVFLAKPTFPLSCVAAQLDQKPVTASPLALQSQSMLASVVHSRWGGGLCMLRSEARGNVCLSVAECVPLACGRPRTRSWASALVPKNWADEIHPA